MLSLGIDQLDQRCTACQHRTKRVEGVHEHGRAHDDGAPSANGCPWSGFESVAPWSLIKSLLHPSRQAPLPSAFTPLSMIGAFLQGEDPWQTAQGLIRKRGNGTLLG